MSCDHRQGSERIHPRRHGVPAEEVHEGVHNRQPNANANKRRTSANMASSGPPRQVWRRIGWFSLEKFYARKQRLLRSLNVNKAIKIMSQTQVRVLLLVFTLICLFLRRQKSHILIRIEQPRNNLTGWSLVAQKHSWFCNVGITSPQRGLSFETSKQILSKSRDVSSSLCRLVTASCGQ